MLLNIDLLTQIVPFGHLWGYGSHMGGFSPFLFFVMMLILFAVLRGPRGHHRRSAGYYRPQPPRYHQGSPFERHEQDPESSHLPRHERYPGGSTQYNPYAGQGSASRGAPYAPPSGGYGAPVPPADQGEPTVRVDSQAYDQGQPTVRVVPPATTMRIDSAETGGHPTTPLGSTQQPPPESPYIERGNVDPADDNRD